jgi:hypothetical protein
MLAAAATSALSSVATGMFVSDVTIYGINDVVQVAANAGSSTQDELVLVTAISGTTNGTLTVTRGFASSSANTITGTNVLKILGVATTENGTVDNPRVPSRSNKTSGCQIFEWPIAITQTGCGNQGLHRPGRRPRGKTDARHAPAETGD